ncbi:MAG: DUF2802 domain-containing protein [Bacteroidales bacterium]|nr:DUF2802 domain-containing protein [Bacteroidales bacterium]
MLIANPIYDAVFKYLLEDNKIAKLLLSDLLNIEILELKYQPKEYIYEKEKSILTLYRVDFKARIKDKKGIERVVLIEIQKTKFLTDLMRFRSYLGNQYADPNNVRKDESGNDIPLPLISIYLLGYSLSHKVPILVIKPQIIERGSEKELDINEQFINSLTHDTIIVQIPAIRKKRIKDDLEKILSIFNPEGKVHEISIKEDDYPDRYRSIIRRLAKAVANDELKNKMEIEDQVFSEIEAQKRKTELEAIRAEQEKQRAEREKQRAEQEKQKAQLFKVKYAKAMKKMGADIDEIIKETGLSQKEIEDL